MKKPRLLLACDAFLENGSGATAARTVARYFTDMGFEVTVFACMASWSNINENKTGCKFILQPDFKSIQHLYPGNLKEKFDSLLEEFSPDIIFILGSTYSKPLCIFESSTISLAKTIYMPWNQDFYCARSFAYHSNMPCEACLNGQFTHAIRKKCVNKSTATFSLVNRFRLKKIMAKLDNVICSSQDQAHALSAFLNRPVDKIDICPLFFDGASLEAFETTDGDYYIYYAQAAEAKGWKLLPGIIKNCPKSKFILCPPGNAEDAISRCPGLLAMIDGVRVKMVSQTNWKNGLGGLIAHSRGVLIPSIWPTTTEYVLLESLGLGKPVIAFNVGVHREILVNRANSMVAQTGDINEYAKCINELDSEITLRQSIASEALKLYRNITDESYIKKILLRTTEES